MTSALKLLCIAVMLFCIESCTSSSAPPPPAKKPAAVPTQPFQAERTPDPSPTPDEEEEEERRKNDDDDCPYEDGSERNCPKAADGDVKTEEKNDMDANANQRVEWRFDAESSKSKYEDRKFVPYKVDVPKELNNEMRVVDDESKNVKVDWRPTQRSPRTGKIKVYVRDMTRCEAMESDANDCEDFSKEMPEYDTEDTLSWNLDSRGGSSGGLLGGSGGSGGNKLGMILGVLGTVSRLFTGGSLGGGFGSIFNGLGGGGYNGGGFQNQGNFQGFQGFQGGFGNFNRGNFNRGNFNRGNFSFSNNFSRGNFSFSNNFSRGNFTFSNYTFSNNGRGNFTFSNNAFTRQQFGFSNQPGSW